MGSLALAWRAQLRRRLGWQGYAFPTSRSLPSRAGGVNLGGVVDGGGDEWRSGGRNLGGVDERFCFLLNCAHFLRHVVLC